MDDGERFLNYLPLCIFLKFEKTSRQQLIAKMVVVFCLFLNLGHGREPSVHASCVYMFLYSWRFLAAPFHLSWGAPVNCKVGNAVGLTCPTMPFKIKTLLEDCKRESRSPSIKSSLYESVDSDMNQWTSFQTSVKRPSRIHDIADVNKTFLATHDRHMLEELPCWNTEMVKKHKRMRTHTSMREIKRTAIMKNPV